MDYTAEILVPKNIRKERLQEIAKILRHWRSRRGRLATGMADVEAMEGELSPLLVGIKPQNMATQTFLYDPEGEKHRQKLALLFMSKKMVVPLALVDYLNTDFVDSHVPASKIGGSGLRRPASTRQRASK